MRPGWSKYMVEILEKVSNLLEEADDSDFNWRCRYLSAFCKALVDADKKQEALKILDKLLDLTKKKGNCNSRRCCSGPESTYTVTTTEC